MTQGFAFGGDEGPNAFDAGVRYRSGLQNYLIDTGDEVILVDTGLPAGTPEESPDETTMIYTGHDVLPYMEALAALGYAPKQVSKILLTHKHADHSGELGSFPNAEVWVNEHELAAEELAGLANLKAISFTDGSYKNFPESQKVADGIWFIRAEGHTKGNSIVVVEDAEEGLFYMIHGDVTYTDEALYANKLSVVYEDKAAARATLDRIREFIGANATVYLSTHTPLGPENLAAKYVVDLENPPETIPVGELTFKTRTGKYVCSVCGYVYDPSVGDESQGIPAGTPFEALPDDWHCPRCKQPKEKFNAA
uniref:Putative rubredoxin n=1 Tax=uncultured bacterium Contig1491 TaxID=1393439 RepID=W0FJ45_9BACT|nr:putative rubredoxin [uncultured bacterium Contig1491]